MPKPCWECQTALGCLTFCKSWMLLLSFFYYCSTVMVTIDQRFALEIVAKPACIHPSPKISLVSDIRATIRGADPGNVGFFPAPTTSSGVRPTRMPMSVLNSLDEHEPNHHLLELVPSRHSSAQAKIGPCTLPVPKSSSNGLQEMKCVAKLEQGPSTIVHGGELASKFEFLDAFEYKQTPGTYFNTHKLRPLARIMDVARMIIYSPQPIKCVEAVFLALYLTAGIVDCDRIPLSFKTSHDGQVYQHIVLLIRYGAKFGAFGRSRHPGLMTKDIKFSSICDIVEDYKKIYEEAEHLVLKIRVGLVVEHKIHSCNFVCWRHLSLNLMLESWDKVRACDKWLFADPMTSLFQNSWLVVAPPHHLKSQIGKYVFECCEALESHTMKQRKLWNKWLVAGKGADPRRKCLVRKAALDNKLLRSVVELKRNKKVKGEEPLTIAKPHLAETRQVREMTCNNKVQETLLADMRVVSKTRKEKTQDSKSFHANISKPLIKVHVLKSQASRFVRHNAQFVNPKFFSHKSFLRSDLTFFQCRRKIKVSLHLDNANKGTIRSQVKQRKHTLLIHA